MTGCRTLGGVYETPEPPPGQQPGQPMPPTPGYPPTSGAGYPPPTSGAGYPPPTSGAGYTPPAWGGYQAPYQPAVQQYDTFGRPLSDKSKVVAGVLGIALGGFGAGRFYTGHTSTAVAQLLVTIFTCGLGHFWGLVDGIMILVNGGTDAQGRVLRDS
jgi:TM2 domain-containing membrane protein YozV